MHYLRWWHHGDPLADLRSKGFIEFLKAAVATHSDNCIPWPYYRTATGYGEMRHGDRAKVGAHRLVCEMAHGPPPTLEHEAAHSCGNPGCVNSRHIRWASRAENAADMIGHGRSTRGRKSNSVKLTEADVRTIRRLAPTVKHADLAKAFGVTDATVCDITKRRSWNWLD
jgi:hypothetical protein